MAEAYCNAFGGGRFEAESAGLKPGALNPFVVEALLEDGLDIRGRPAQSVFELFKAGRTYRYVITVCSREAEEGCPVFPGVCERLNWPFPDPSRFEGSHDEVMARVREVRDAIKARIIRFLEETAKT